MKKEGLRKFQKIMVIGPRGSGKSTFSKKLSGEISIPVYHLDAYFFTDGWQEVSPLTF